VLYGALDVHEGIIAVGLCCVNTNLTYKSIFVFLCRVVPCLSINKDEIDSIGENRFQVVVLDIQQALETISKIFQMIIVGG
jgi:hypothetical protein